MSEPPGNADSADADRSSPSRLFALRTAASEEGRSVSFGSARWRELSSTLRAGAIAQRQTEAGREYRARRVGEAFEARNQRHGLGVSFARGRVVLRVAAGPTAAAEQAALELDATQLGCDGALSALDAVPAETAADAGERSTTSSAAQTLSDQVNRT